MNPLLVDTENFNFLNINKNRIKDGSAIGDLGSFLLPRVLYLVPSLDHIKENIWDYMRNP